MTDDGEPMHDSLRELNERRKRDDLRSDAVQLLDVAEDPAEIFQLASTALAMPDGRHLSRVIVRGADDDAEYDLHLNDGTEIACGTEATLRDPRKMDARIARAIKRNPPYYMPKQWRSIALALIRAAEPDAATGGRQDEAADWLADYAHNGHVCPRTVNLDDAADLFDTLGEWAAFRGDDDRFYIHVPTLVSWVTQSYGQRTSARDLARRLARLGFTRPRNAEGKLAARNGSQVVTRRLLASPPGFDPHAGADT